MFSLHWYSNFDDTLMNILTYYALIIILNIVRIINTAMNLCRKKTPTIKYSSGVTSITRSSARNMHFGCVFKKIKYKSIYTWVKNAVSFFLNPVSFHFIRQVAYKEITIFKSNLPKFAQKTKSKENERNAMQNEDNQLFIINFCLNYFLFMSLYI